MRIRIRKLTSLLLSLSLLSALTLPAAASAAMGEDLTAKDTLIHRETQLSTNVFWSEAYSDLRTENLITYTPNQAVTPIVTYGDVLTDRSSVADMAAALEAEGYRVVAGINGDFYNVNTGLPIGLVVTDGVLRSSDAGYYAIGFRADGTAILGKPSIRVSADLGYTVDDGFGTSTEVVRPVAAVNKARTNSGIFLYTYDFNAKHTTGTTEAGVNVVCAIEEGSLTIGGTVTARVERVEESTVTALQPGEIVLSANSQADTYYSAALQSMQPGSAVTLSVTAADEGWNDVKYAVGALYCLAENGVVASGLAAGTNPRTAVGQKADGTLVFYTVDGRRSGHSIGASMTQVGERLLELGCQTVLCLDGGGSTNLAVTTPDSTTATIINRPSETGRKVTNQVFLVASDRASGDLDHFYVHAASDYVLAGSSVYVTATGVDSSFIPMPVPNHTLTASAGTLENGVLTTPAGGGDITVTASGRGASGSTVVHAIRNPDNLTLKNGASNLTELTVTPGSKTALTAGAVWNHLPLTATNEAFTWSVSGDIGTVDEHGVFTASAPGTGNLTVSAGDKSLTIPVTVAQAALQTIEDFETPDTRFFSGYYLTVSRTNVSNHVQRGHYAGKLDYVLPEDTGYYSQAMAGSFSTLRTPYTALNLWVYGDGSGNQLSFLYTGDIKSDLELPVTTLDFTGWKQINVPLPQDFTLSGVVIYAPSTTDATWDHIQVTYADTPRTGTVYIDQITAAFPGTVDNAPPVVTATLDQQNWAVDIKVSDGVDGILPLSAITVARNGDTGQVLEGYDTATGTMKYYLPGPGEANEATRVTVTAADASGNIGRASVDIPPYGVSHKFTDIDDYWAADYVDFLYNADITTGYSDGTFRPNQNISRAQFAVMLYRYLKLDANKYESVSLPFADLGQIPAYALPAAKALYSEGIITGSEKNGKLYFNPDSSLTRAQAAAMIGRTQAKGYAEAELTFTDNGKIPAYAAPYIRTMTAQGVISGYSDGSFKPNNNITRGQMAKILYNLM
ncbi:S-layer homology domain-containing protein [Neopoerus faecalis]|uniref:S-layer homology domain-containing protein n=1 Tax=Neopoerus faecalis TaxID=3032125 RepID=UPI0025713243|nr:S-layer homology domain-containing protein [Neopoerus faecalis]